MAWSWSFRSGCCIALFIYRSRAVIVVGKIIGSFLSIVDYRTIVRAFHLDVPFISLAFQSRTKILSFESRGRRADDVLKNIFLHILQQQTTMTKETATLPN